MEHSEDPEHMGNCTCAQKEKKDAKDGGKGSKLVKQVSDPYKYQWEQNVIDTTIMGSGKVEKAAMIGLEDGALRAWSPPNFIPEQQCIDDIISAFNGETSGLAERGLNVGCGVYPSVPGKMDDDGIYGNDGHRGGTSAFKSKECILVLVFKANPMLANRLGLEVVSDMKEIGK